MFEGEKTMNYLKLHYILSANKKSFIRSEVLVFVFGKERGKKRVIAKEYLSLINSNRPD